MAGRPWLDSKRVALQAHLVEVHEEGVRVAGAHVEDVCFERLHGRRASLQEGEHRQLPQVLVLAQQRERPPALTTVQRSAAAAAVQLL